MANSGERPPELAFALCVGVTGHRSEALAAADPAALGRRVDALLGEIEAAALALLASERSCFSDEPPLMTLVSPLAGGADQLVAARAIERGWDLQAVLPMERGAYRGSMPADDARELDRLADRSRCLLELPGDPARPLDAFVMAGRATVAHSDLLIALWDGQPARGRGGTAETIERALVRGTPVIHLPVDPAEPVTILWSAFDPVVVTEVGDHGCGRPATPESIAIMLTALLAPPNAEIERSFVRRYLGERARRLSLRVEYPLLMAVAGARRIRRRDLSAKPRIAAAHGEWAEYRAQCQSCHGVEAPLDRLQAAYEWSDRLATHFAQTYRSSHVLNFVLAALGAWIGLSGLVLDVSPRLLAATETLVVTIIIVNTVTGSRRCWHQRWLDYRQLAERLRPMRSLKLLGVAAPDAPGSAAEPVARRWIDWYAGAMWRSMGCPAGRIAEADVTALARAITEKELDPQIAYNRRNASEVRNLDRRLERLALALFVATLLIALISAVYPAALAGIGAWSTVLSAGLPVLGTAIFGIRVQGDFGALSARSNATAAQLERLAEELRTARSLPRAADLAEQAGRVMLADLGEWRLVNELHELSLA